MVCRHEHPQLPLDDFVEEAVGGQTLAHGVGEARQFDPAHAHHADTAQLHVADKAENYRALSQRGEGLANWIGLLVVVQNIFTSLFNSHIFDFHEGWMYVIGVGVAGGLVLKMRGTAGAPAAAGS